MSVMLAAYERFKTGRETCIPGNIRIIIFKFYFQISEINFYFFLQENLTKGKPRLPGKIQPDKVYQKCDIVL
jgi:hypothetical protein